MGISIDLLGALTVIMSIFTNSKDYREVGAIVIAHDTNSNPPRRKKEHKKDQDGCHTND
jgi:hypothetical protein